MKDTAWCWSQAGGKGRAYGYLLAPIDTTPIRGWQLPPSSLPELPTQESPVGVRTGRADRELSWAPSCQAQPCLLRDSPPVPSPASASWVVCTQREHDWGWFGSVQILFISEQACFYVQDGDLRNHTQHREECPSLSTARRGSTSSPGPSTSSAQGLHQAALKPVGASKEAANSQAPDLWLLQDGTRQPEAR